jgi:polysaccharide export outer membrane protein
MFKNRALSIAGALLLVSSSTLFAQTSPLAQPPPDPPSPVIIVPPEAQKDASKKPEAGKDAGAAAAQDETKPSSGTGKKNGKGKPDPSALPGKDPTATRGPYVIGPDDALFIRVWREPELSGSVTVGPDGTISLQLIDEVKAAGFTPRQLEEELVKRFSKFLKEPEVNVQVLRVNSRTYMIQGEGVNRPGIYPITRPLTIMEALVSGGGFNAFANKKKIYVLRGSQKLMFNWVDVSKGKNLDQNIQIQNGDQIFVP